MNDIDTILLFFTCQVLRACDVMKIYAAWFTGKSLAIAFGLKGNWV
jgi:hypothetical protein